MLYNFIKFLGQFAIHLFCRKIIINDKTVLKSEGPILLAANHPNSFLDSLIIDFLFKKPVHSLARGDVFKKPFYANLLTQLYILPVYRTSEGVENLSTNYETFNACVELFKRKGIVTIYSEGRCVNEWHLRPLKKGTARLALQTWEHNIPLKVIPVSINYSSFTKFGKNVFINFGKPIEKNDVPPNESDGIRNVVFNKILQEELAKGIYEIDHNDAAKHKDLLEFNVSWWKKIILFLPGMIGWLLHQPLYFPLANFSAKKTRGTGHYDSVIIALLLLTYPLYLLLIAFTTASLTHCGWAGIVAFFTMPALAWSYVQIKSQQK